MICKNMSDNELISFALKMWGNYIETTTLEQSAECMRSKTYEKKNHKEPNLLTSDQKNCLNRIRNLQKGYEENAK